MISKEEFTKNMTYLGLAYGKEYTREEVEINYDFLKENTDEVITGAIKRIIKKSKFLPKIGELIQECEETEKSTKWAVIEFMKSKGYFHQTGQTMSEFDKTIKFLEKKTIPTWLLEDMRKYYRMMQQEQLEHKQTLMIGK